MRGHNKDRWGGNIFSAGLVVGMLPMVEHGSNRIVKSPMRGRDHFLALVGLGLLAVAGGMGGGLLADRLWPDAPAGPATPADDAGDEQESER
jgi:hypothetical protein